MKKKNHQKFYTVGEIFRAQLMLSFSGDAHKTKASVLRVVQRIPHKKVKTRFGEGYAVAVSEIKAHNNRVKEAMDSMSPPSLIQSLTRKGML
jgi:hypothetical protein